MVDVTIMDLSAERVGSLRFELKLLFPHRTGSERASIFLPENGSFSFYCGLREDLKAAKRRYSQNGSS